MMIPQPENLPKRNFFLVIEGIDGVGKTTIAQAISKRVGAIYVKTPLPLIEHFSFGNVSLRQHIDSYAYTSPITRFMFYLYTVAEASNYIKSKLATNNVVCDRYLSSTIAYHRALFPGLPDIDFKWIVEVMPQCQILLTISDRHELVRRLSEREGRFDEKLESDIMFLERVEEEYRKLGLKEIDTTKKSVDTIVNEIIDCMM